jgi:hypothetical protein
MTPPRDRSSCSGSAKACIHQVFKFNGSPDIPSGTRSEQVSPIYSVRRDKSNPNIWWLPAAAINIRHSHCPCRRVTYMTDLPGVEAPVIILGAGPAGLTAAYELTKNSVSSVLLEQNSSVGGLSRTVEYKGNRFDLGGHRFYTKIPIVEQIWHEVLGKELLVRPRLSRIYYKSKFFRYPIEPLDAVRGLGLLEGIRCCGSMMKSRLFPCVPEHSFERCVSNRFGRRLFEIFFKTYTEKVWGIDCSEIQADWAAQRIGGLSLCSMLGEAIFPRRSRGIRTLSGNFNIRGWAQA